jgi:hypothetical protein
MVALPTWDLVITLFFILAIGYGLILGRDKVVVTLISTYIGFVVANEFGNTLYALFTGKSALGGSFWVQTNLSIFLVKTILFILLIVLLGAKGGYIASPGNGGLKSGILTGILSFLNAGLIISSLIWFLSEASRNALFSQSHLAFLIASVRNWWLILPVIVLLIAGFLTPKKED